MHVWVYSHDLGGAANGEFGDCNVKTSQDFYILGIYFENINIDLGFQCGLGISCSVHSFHASFNLWINVPSIIDAKASFHHHFEVFLFSQAHKAGSYYGNYWWLKIIYHGKRKKEKEKKKRQVLSQVQSSLLFWLVETLQAQIQSTLPAWPHGIWTLPGRKVVLSFTALSKYGESSYFVHLNPLPSRCRALEIKILSAEIIKQSYMCGSMVWICCSMSNLGL